MKKNKTLIISVLLCGLLGANEIGQTNGSIIISSQEIKAMNIQMLVDLLNKLPGVKASDGFISIQGSTTNEVLVLFDGRPLTDSLTGTANLGGISTDNLEKIEIIKGAGAAQYGDNTSGGVIMITSKKTGKSFVNKLDIAKGSLDTNKYGLNVGKSFDGIGVSLGANHEKSDGHRLNGDSEVNSMKIDLNTLLFRDIDTSFTTNYITDKGGTTGKITKPTLNARYEKESFGALVLLKNDSFEGRGYLNCNEDFNTDPDYSIDSFLKTKTLGTDIKHNGDLSFLGQSIVGINFENRSAEATNSGDHNENLYGIYGIKNLNFGEFGINLGLRLNSHTEFGSSFNPELGLMYKNGDFRSDLKISRSSKTPTFKQRYYESSTLKGNPDLEMESATNYQLGNSIKVTDNLSANFNLFYSKIDDGISGSYNADGIYIYENVTSSTRKGYEAGFDVKINDMLNIDTSYLNLIFKNDDTGLYLPAKPKHKIQSDIYATYKNFKANLGGYYVSESFNDNKNKEVLPGYFSANSKVEYGYKNMKFYVEVENLFDKDYDVHIGYPAAGRTYLFGMNYLF
ncbi:MAG: Plug protein [Campylobacterota bacterium]|nr:Plug protein [Campylobacterota bacterium]